MVNDQVQQGNLFPSEERPAKTRSFIDGLKVNQDKQEEKWISGSDESSDEGLLDHVTVT
jgi:hypothetical protein